MRSESKKRLSILSAGFLITLMPAIHVVVSHAACGSFSFYQVPEVFRPWYVESVSREQYDIADM